MAKRSNRRKEMSQKKKVSLKPLLALMIAGAAVAWWMSLTDSKRRFFKHMAKQMPWMPFRYFA